MTSEGELQLHIRRCWNLVQVGTLWLALRYEAFKTTCAVFIF